MNQPVTLDQWPMPPDTLIFGAVRLLFVGRFQGEPARGLAPAYQFRVVIADGLNAGHLNFRVGDTEHVRLCAGHIGYAILEPFRGRGYAQQACRAVAPFVRVFYDAVIITCDPDNAASRRTIENLGASFLDEVSVPPSDPHYERGSRSKLRYCWTP